MTDTIADQVHQDMVEYTLPHVREQFPECTPKLQLILTDALVRYWSVARHHIFSSTIVLSRYVRHGEELVIEIETISRWVDRNKPGSHYPGPCRVYRRVQVAETRGYTVGQLVRPDAKIPRVTHLDSAPV